MASPLVRVPRALAKRARWEIPSPLWLKAWGEVTKQASRKDPEKNLCWQQRLVAVGQKRLLAERCVKEFNLRLKKKTKGLKDVDSRGKNKLLKDVQQ